MRSSSSGRAARRDIGRQRHVAALGDRLIEHRAVEREGEASPRRPRLSPRRVASSWPRKHTLPSSPKRTASPTASRLPGFTKARQREPSSRLTRFASIGVSGPRPMRRPMQARRDHARVVDDKLVAGPQQIRQIAHHAVLERRSPAAPPAAAPHRAGAPGRSAIRSGGRCESRTGRCACSLSASAQADDPVIRNRDSHYLATM